jgi:hypothetical protein
VTHGNITYQRLKLKELKIPLSYLAIPSLCFFLSIFLHSISKSHLSVTSPDPLRRVSFHFSSITALRRGISSIPSFFPFQFED